MKQVARELVQSVFSKIFNVIINITITVTSFDFILPFDPEYSKLMMLLSTKLINLIKLTQELYYVLEYIFN